jgi:hypothetical protein
MRCLAAALQGHLAIRKIGRQNTTALASVLFSTIICSAQKEAAFVGKLGHVHLWRQIVMIQKTNRRQMAV